METAFGTQVLPLYYSEAEYNKANPPQSQATAGSFTHHRGFSGKSDNEQAELLARMQAEHKEPQVALSPASEPAHVKQECFDLGDDDDDDDDDFHHDAQNQQESVPVGPPSVPSFAGPSSRFETAVAEWDFVSAHIQLRCLCTLLRHAILCCS
jgi:hypothetical protein